MSLTAFDVRRENLRIYIRDKYESNKSAFARAAGVSPNHIILLLTDNEGLRRNLGEALTRRIEKALHLNTGWFDAERRPGGTATFEVSALSVCEQLSNVFRQRPELERAVCLQSVLSSMTGSITSLDNLRIAQIATNDMAPELQPGDHVFIDSGAQALTSNGIYVVEREASVFLRRVTKKLDGGWLFNGGLDGPQSLPSMQGVRSLGRVVLTWRASAP